MLIVNAMKSLLTYLIEEKTECAFTQESELVQSYAINGVNPDYVLMPKTVQEISEALRAASKARTSIIPWGGGTRIHFGGNIISYNAALDVTHLHSILEYAPAELMIRVEAGAGIGVLNDVLRKNNQFIPLNPPFIEKATIGGILASNSWGYLREAYGTAKDFTLGLKFVCADGRVIQTGGIVAKNVAGYDITKLLIGSWGTLGVISEVALRVYPLPEVQSTGIIQFKNLSTCTEFLFELYNTHYSPSFAIVINKAFAQGTFILNNVSINDVPYYCIVGLDGLSETVQWQETSITNLSQKYSTEWMLISEQAGRMVRAILQNYQGTNKSVLCKVVSTRTGTINILDYVNTLQRESLIETLTFFDNGVSLIAISYLDEKSEIEKKVVLDMVMQLQHYSKLNEGYCILDSVPVWFKTKLLMRQQYPGEHIMKRIKNLFDPLTILNPGRYI